MMYTVGAGVGPLFGGLLNERRHWTHPVIHETLVDLLMIQQKIHRGVFAVMDGTFAGDGPGPRCMIPRVKNVILASADQVAIGLLNRQYHRHVGTVRTLQDPSVFLREVPGEGARSATNEQRRRGFISVLGDSEPQLPCLLLRATCATKTNMLQA